MIIKSSTIRVDIDISSNQKSSMSNYVNNKTQNCSKKIKHHDDKLEEYLRDEYGDPDEESNMLSKISFSITPNVLIGFRNAINVNNINVSLNAKPGSIGEAGENGHITNNGKGLGADEKMEKKVVQVQMVE